MFLLILFAFLAGVVTILSPCILPVLPIVLSSTIGGESTGKGRPLGVVTGFILSFTFFTLFLSTIVRLSGIPSDTLRIFSVVVIALFGASLLIAQFQVWMERLFSKLSNIVPQTGTRKGFGSGFIIGLSLGLLWTPCVGPILASVISLALIGTVTFGAFLITLSYSLGTAIPMFLIILGGQNALRRVPWLLSHTAQIQKTFGVIMILTAAAIFFNFDRTFQSYILQTFPKYGTGLTKIEDNSFVKQALQSISNKPMNTSDMGKPLSEVNQMKGPPAPEIIPGGEWFNTQPVKLSDFRGKVVLIDFWTYSCINCQRTLPYLKSWWDKYHDKGLIIIGVHSPEFEFEKDPKNVAQAIKDFGIKYPVVQDNNLATWQAYNNEYWPAEYFIDKDGLIRHTHFGEGDYDTDEKEIQQLLSETGKTVNEKIDNPTYNVYAQTPESYLGYARIQNIASPEKINQDQEAEYSVPNPLPQNYFAYQGKWTVKSEYAEPANGSKLDFNFNAMDVYLVASPKNGSSQMKVMVDGKPQYFGIDAQDGVVTVDKDRLYKLVHLSTPGAHVLEIQFDGNVQVYAFTFG